MIHAPTADQIERVPGLKQALLAISYFRHRHTVRPRFKTGRRRGQMMRVEYARYVELARLHMRAARARGFRGSIIDALGRAA